MQEKATTDLRRQGCGWGRPSEARGGAGEDPQKAWVVVGADPQKAGVGFRKTLPCTLTGSKALPGP